MWFIFICGFFFYCSVDQWSSHLKREKKRILSWKFPNKIENDRKHFFWSLIASLFAVEQKSFNEKVNKSNWICKNSFEKSSENCSWIVEAEQTTLKKRNTKNWQRNNSKKKKRRSQTLNKEHKVLDLFDCEQYCVDLCAQNKLK